MIDYTDVADKNQDLIQKYEMKKHGNLKTIDFIPKHISESGLMRMKSCGDFLALVANKDLDKRKLYSGVFCKNRFCPMCAYRQARKDAFKITMLMKYIEVVQDKSFVFITLTAPNVKGNELKLEIDRYNLAFKNLMKRKEILPVSKGYIRKLEITYDNDPLITHDMWYGNPDKNIKSRADYYKGLGLSIGDSNPNYDTYHPHFHVVMAVNQSYFKGRNYIKQSVWLDMWRSVMGDESITQVRVEKIKKSSENKHVLEVAKYAAKDSDMLISQSVFDCFYEALKGRQIITYNGLLSEASKLYKLFLKKKGEDKQKDVFNSFIGVDETEYIYFLLYRWGYGTYAQAEFRELTADERKKINRQAIDELEIE